MIPVTVLRSGGEYDARHVRWLAKQVPGLVCLSDVRVQGVLTVPIRHDWPKWWSKMNLFSDAIDGDLLHIDLDTVVLGSLDAFDVRRTTMLSDFYRPHLLASGLMYIKQEDKAAIWAAFLSDPKGHMKRHERFPLIGDQGFLNGRIKAQRWQDVLPGQVASYKVHCLNGPTPTAKVVCFHGQPRPWGVRHNWIPRLEP